MAGVGYTLGLEQLEFGLWSWVVMRIINIGGLLGLYNLCITNGMKSDENHMGLSLCWW